MRLATAMLFAVVLGAAARAQLLPSAGGLSASVSGGSKGESHAWVALPVADADGGAAIVHLPPRRAVNRSDTIADVQDGSVRLALRLPRMPERLAAWENRLWIAFPAESAVGGKRRVLTMSVERGPLGGSWISEETDGRLPALPLLPGDQELVGFAGSSRGPAALLYAAGRSEYTLLLMTASGWSRMPLPPEAVATGDSGSRLSLLCSPKGLSLAATGAIWEGEFAARAAAGSGEEVAPEVHWSLSGRRFATETGLAAPSAKLPIVRSGGELVYGASAPGGAIELWSPGLRACRLLATVGGVARRAALVPLDQVGRVALIWLEEDKPGPAAAGSQGLSTHIVEVSALTGGVLYDGPARVGGPVSAAELKLLAMVLVGVMVMVLLFVLRPDKPGAPLSLPPGLALAEPGRRVVAAGIDVLVALVGAAAIKHVPLREMLAPGALLYDPAGVETIVLILGLGILHSTLGEGLLGASIGKLLVRCRVVRVMAGRGGDTTPVARLPGLGRALVRNVIRWTLAPVALSGLSTPEHRHRGDLAAGTVVVIRVAPSEASG